ncbi:hypothetical protein WK33_27245 [Burkholderia multivorans]|nr:hypothetical protein WK33_27245 [Burkholderia multivorans]
MNANEEFKGRITVVTYLDNGESFTEYAYCNGTFAKEDEAYEAAVFMKYRWQVPELIGGL